MVIVTLYLTIQIFFSKIPSLHSAIRSLHLKISGIKKMQHFISQLWFFFFSQCKLTFWNSEFISHKPFFSELQDISLQLCRKIFRILTFFPCNWKFTSRNSCFFLRILTFFCNKIKNYCDFLTHNFDFLAIASLNNLNCEICVEEYCEIKSFSFIFLSSGGNKLLIR